MDVEYKEAPLLEATTELLVVEELQSAVLLEETFEEDFADEEETAVTLIVRLECLLPIDNPLEDTVVAGLEEVDVTFATLLLAELFRIELPSDKVLGRVERSRVDCERVAEVVTVLLSEVEELRVEDFEPEPEPEPYLTVDCTVVREPPTPELLD